MGFDHPCDACEPIACVRVNNSHDSASVLPTATPELFPIAQFEAESRGRKGAMGTLTAEHAEHAEHAESSE
jgi:hypothetical protein